MCESELQNLMAGAKILTVHRICGNAGGGGSGTLMSIFKEVVTDI